MPGIARIVEIGLKNDVRVALQELQHRPFADLALVEQPIDDRIVDEGGAALVHHLGLPLRIEILRDDPHDAEQLALPGLQDGLCFSRK